MLKNHNLKNIYFNAYILNINIINKNYNLFFDFIFEMLSCYFNKFLKRK